MSLFIPELIRRKRDDGALDEQEIRRLITAYTEGEIPDYQMAAMLMAVFFRGLSQEELGAWTDAMLHSGEVMIHSGVNAPKVDKHSTGGVGDKISLCLAPAVAALGVPVPMVSGRGLGHTGGTLDKLEAIPGFNVNLPVEEASRMLEELGIFLIGQTLDLAPADRKLYALRDVTGTVESIPLIASSIMSKKLAEGIDGLVLDVKVGAGAFMGDLEHARELARTLKGIGESAQKRVTALITDMNTPLGWSVGNALEVEEAIQIMRGEGPKDTTALTVELGAEMLLLGEACTDLDHGRKKMEEVLSDGRALELFAKTIERQGGDPRVCEDTRRLPSTGITTAIKSDRAGFVTAVNPRKAAFAALEVGAGRKVKEDDVDPATGVDLRCRPGKEIASGETLAILHHREGDISEAAALLRSAFDIGDEAPGEHPLFIDRL